MRLSSDDGHSHKSLVRKRFHRPCGRAASGTQLCRGGLRVLPEQPRLLGPGLRPLAGQPRAVDLVARIDALNQRRFRGDAERLAAWASATNVYGRAKRRPALEPPVPAPGAEQDVAA